MIIKIHKHIEIVRSTTCILSSMSQKSCRAIFATLNRHYSTVGISVVNNISDLEALALKQPDLVFMGMKYIPGKEPDSKIWISEYLDQMGITHTGSNQRAIEFDLNKPSAKRRVHELGIATARFVVIKREQMGEATDINKLTFPLFVKPTNLGGGTGIDETSIVHNMRELRTKVSSITQSHVTDVLVEEYLPGREFSVAILKSLGSSKLLAMPIELVAPVNAQGNPVLSQAIKFANEEVVLAVIDPKMYRRVTAIAIDVFNALGARDYGRIDIRLDKYGAPHFLEANLIPSLISGYGSFPKACELIMAMNYEDMILGITNLGFDRIPVLRNDKPKAAPNIGTLLRPTATTAAAKIMS